VICVETIGKIRRGPFTASLHAAVSGRSIGMFVRPLWGAQMGVYERTIAPLDGRFRKNWL